MLQGIHLGSSPAQVGCVPWTDKGKGEGQHPCNSLISRLGREQVNLDPERTPPPPAAVKLKDLSAQGRAGDPRLQPTGQTTSLGTGWGTLGTWGFGLMETNNEGAPGLAVLTANHLSAFSYMETNCRRRQEPCGRTQ